jgi:hypothetical protein
MSSAAAIETNDADQLPIFVPLFVVVALDDSGLIG